MSPETIGAARFLALCGRRRAALKALTPEALDLEWAAVDAVKAAAETPVETAVAEWAGDVVYAVAEKIAEREAKKRDPGDANAARLLLDAVFDLGAIVAAWDDVLAPALLRAIRAGFEAGRLRLPPSLDIGFDGSDALTSRTLRRLVEKAASVPETLRERVASVITDGLTAGDSPRALADRLRASAPEIAETRAKAVAQTSGTGAFEAGQGQTFRAAGMNRRWLSQRDGKARDTHDAADGQEVGPEDAFDVGGHSAMHPADPHLPASESVNCRCTVLPILGEPAAPEPETRTARRNTAIRDAYPALKAERGAEAAFDALGEAHHISPHTARAIVYRRGPYADP